MKIVSLKLDSMVITNRHVSILTVVAFYITLTLHDHNLYPNLSTPLFLLLSLLRIFLLLSTLVAGFFIVKKNISVRLKIFLIVLWLLVLPYSAYSLAEIRHVSELCRLGYEHVFTEVCITQSWKVAPIFIYALTGVLIFVFSVSQVAAGLFRRSLHKRLFMLAICLYCAFAATFGLYTRINMWDIFVRPLEVLSSVFKTVSLPGFVSNTFIFTSFFAGILFVVNRIIRKAGKLID